MLAIRLLHVGEDVSSLFSTAPSPCQANLACFAAFGVEGEVGGSMMILGLSDSIQSGRVPVAVAVSKIRSRPLNPWGEDSLMA